MGNDLLGDLTKPSDSDAKDEKGIVESIGNTVDNALGTDGLVGGLGDTADKLLQETGLEDKKGDLDVSEITNLVNKL